MKGEVWLLEERDVVVMVEVKGVVLAWEEIFMIKFTADPDCFYTPCGSQCLRYHKNFCIFFVCHPNYHHINMSFALKPCLKFLLKPSVYSSISSAKSLFPRREWPTATSTNRVVRGWENWMIFSWDGYFRSSLKTRVTLQNLHNLLTTC